MGLKDADKIANSVDPDQTAPLISSLIWVYTVCPEFSVRKLGIITVVKVVKLPCCSLCVCVCVFVCVCVSFSTVILSYPSIVGM